MGGVEVRLAAGDGRTERDQPPGDGGARGARFRAAVTARAQVEEGFPGPTAAGAVGEGRVGSERGERGFGIGEGGREPERAPGRGRMATEGRGYGVVMAFEGGIEQEFAGVRTFDGLLQFRPARKAGFAGDDQLRFAQGERRGQDGFERDAPGTRQMTGDAERGFEAALLVIAPEVLGAFALLLDVEANGRIDRRGHETTFQ